MIGRFELALLLVVVVDLVCVECEVLWISASSESEDAKVLLLSGDGSSWVRRIWSSWLNSDCESSWSPWTGELDCRLACKLGYSVPSMWSRAGISSNCTWFSCCCCCCCCCFCDNPDSGPAETLPTGPLFLLPSMLGLKTALFVSVLVVLRVWINLLTQLKWPLDFESAVQTLCN